HKLLHRGRLVVGRRVPVLLDAAALITSSEHGRQLLVRRSFGFGCVTHCLRLRVVRLVRGGLVVHRLLVFGDLFVVDPLDLLRQLGVPVGVRPEVRDPPLQVRLVFLVGDRTEVVHVLHHTVLVGDLIVGGFLLLVGELLQQVVLLDVGVGGAVGGLLLFGA